MTILLILTSLGGWDQWELTPVILFASGVECFARGAALFAPFGLGKVISRVADLLLSRPHETHVFTINLAVLTCDSDIQRYGFGRLCLRCLGTFSLLVPHLPALVASSPAALFNLVDCLTFDGLIESIGSKSPLYLERPRFSLIVTHHCC